ncbi:hypothetical protein [Streptomyces olivaceus]|uniref:hypothetical protein n=1 Tax=Streptomyces olivaceus TaxID=47716 RepID=UPI0022ED977D|nr:hypothetical protein [Streptomyces olivaceus]GHI91707.1 hypothetical protein TPA0905_11780 [Streptomyces olivaceus]
MTDTRIALNLFFASDDKPSTVATRVGEVVAAEVPAPLVGMHWTAFDLTEEDGDEIDWEAVAEERERRLKAAGEARHNAEQERDAVYRERAHLVALLAAMTDNAVMTPALDVPEPGWWIVYLTLGGRQASWYIAPRDTELFDHVTTDDCRDQRDGHTTEEKYAGIAAWTAELAKGK